MKCHCQFSAQQHCQFCTETQNWWGRYTACYVYHCSNPAILTDPPEWAYGNTRKATVGDSSTGRVIEDADYIAVRSCFCRCERCKHFVSG